MGNLWSVASAVRHLGAEPHVTDSPNEISVARILILPGVGSFRRAMEIIRAKSIDAAIFNALTQPSTKLLGICLGMQLLGSASTEDGATAGLCLVPNVVRRFESTDQCRLKIPHVGFSEVYHRSDTHLFSDIPSGACFYFVHSYYMAVEGLTSGIATSDHGTNFLAAFENSQVSGTQFHPEKSQSSGLMLLNNFIKE